MAEAKTLDEAISELEQTMDLLNARISSLCRSIERAARATAPEPEKNDVLTVQEAADLLKMTRQGLYGLVNKKQIPYFKIGGAVRFNRSDLLHYRRSV
jgi:excisionase family DNA binding protein